MLCLENPRDLRRLSVAVALVKEFASGLPEIFAEYIFTVEEAIWLADVFHLGLEGGEGGGDLPAWDACLYFGRGMRGLLAPESPNEVEMDPRIAAILVYAFVSTLATWEKEDGSDGW